MHEGATGFALSPTRPEGSSIAAISLQVDKVLFQIYVVPGSDKRHLPELFPYRLADDPVPCFVGLYLCHDQAVAKRREFPIHTRRNRVRKRTIRTRDFDIPVFVVISRLKARRVAVTLSEVEVDYSRSGPSLHFSARLAVNGAVVGDVANDGTGQANRYQWGTAFVDLGRKLKEAAERLSPVSVKDDVVPADLDLTLSPLVSKTVTVLYMYVVD